MRMIKNCHHIISDLGTEDHKVKSKKIKQMKTPATLSILALLSIFIISDAAAQVPSGFNFQAVARDGSGNLLTNQDIGVRIEILEVSDDGSAVYSETHLVNSGNDGLLHLVIGQGDSQDDFSAVNWAGESHFVRLAIDPSGGSNYEELGVTQLFSVPYAMVAHNVIEGYSVGEEAITEYHLNTSDGDTSFTIHASGSESLSALRVNANTDDQNVGIRSNAQSESSSSQIQVGVWGTAMGDATGSHYALLGQSSSQGRYNYGAYGSASGEGSGEIVYIGDEDEFAGSFNIGGGFYSSGNINGNLGVEGVASGSAGERVNIGVEGRAIATSGAENIGVNGFAEGSTHVNFATSGIAEGEHGRNVAIRGLAFNGDANIGGYFRAADTAAVFHGPVTVVNSELIVNGNITHTGDINQTSDRNLKAEIEPLRVGLAAIMQLRPKTYRFRGDGSYKGMTLAPGKRMGLIAQDVAHVLPALVTTKTHQYTEEVWVDADAAGPDSHTGSGSAETVQKTMEYQSMNYTELIPVLIKAVQEQQEEIELLREELARMRE